MLNSGPFLDTMLAGLFPSVLYCVNGVERTVPYFLADGIYPNWAVFVQALSNPLTVKEKVFTQRQEAARKDVERAFGVLQSRWSILYHPSRFWYKGI